MKVLRSILVLLALCSTAQAQQTLLQSGPWIPGHAPQYVGSGSSQPVLQDSGTAAGGAIGVGLSELGITVRGIGTGPFSNGGTGPYYANLCDYDGPVTNVTTGYHYFCFSPNAQGGGLIAYGAAGGAAQLPLNFIVNGVTYSFPFSSGGIVGPGTTTIGDLAVWNNTTGTLLKDVAQLTLAQLPSIGGGTVLGNSTGGLATPTALSTLPTAVQGNITSLGTIASGMWNGTPIIGTYIGSATVTGSNIAASTIAGSNIAAATVTGSNIASNTVANSNLSNMAADTAKCNPTGGSAVAQDCTGSQLATALGLATSGAANVYTTNHTIGTGDCNTLLQMGSGSTGQLTLTLPAVAGFTAPCPITVYNGDTYSSGNSRGKILAGFPSPVYYILFPQQSFKIEISNGAWVPLEVPARWPQSGAQFYAQVGGSDTANDCLSTANPCATIAHTATIMYSRYDAQNGEPTLYLVPGTAFTECVQLQGQLTGINVGMIASSSGTGTSGGATWNAAVSCPSNALLTISDNAEWQLQNILMSNAGGTSGIDGVHLHQTGVCDCAISGMAYGMFPGATAIGSDNNSMINMAASYTIVGGGGTTTTFFGIGGATTLNECGSCTTTFTGAPTITTLYSANGAGATISLGPSHTYTGSATIANACSITGPSALSAASNTIPGTTSCTSGSTAHGGQVY